MAKKKVRSGIQRRVKASASRNLVDEINSKLESVRRQLVMEIIPDTSGNEHTLLNLGVIGDGCVQNINKGHFFFPFLGNRYVAAMCFYGKASAYDVRAYNFNNPFSPNPLNDLLSGNWSMRVGAQHFLSENFGSNGRMFLGNKAVLDWFFERALLHPMAKPYEVLKFATNVFSAEKIVVSGYQHYLREVIQQRLDGVGQIVELLG